MMDKLAFFLILALALLSDSLMETLGLLGYCVVAALALAVAGLLQKNGRSRCWNTKSGGTDPKNHKINESTFIIAEWREESQA